MIKLKTRNLHYKNYILVLPQSDDIFNGRIMGGFASSLYKEKYIGVELNILVANMKFLHFPASTGKLIYVGDELSDHVVDINPTSLMKIYRITRR